MSCGLTINSGRIFTTMGDAIITVVIEVAKCLAPPAVRQLNYLRDYTSNLDNLTTEFEKLKGHNASRQHAVDEAKGNGEVIEMIVENWLQSVKDIITEADEFVGDEATRNKHCLKGLCPNLMTRYRHSKEAVRLKKAIVELLEVSFDRISYPTAPEDIRLLPSKDSDAFKSRMSTLNNVLSSLRDPDVNIVGIWGMGGIGKTTLAKEVARQAENGKLFDKVVFVEVSQSPVIGEIQKEIAQWLGHKFTDQVESQPVRASSLFRCIKEKEKILVILDNVWDTLNLRDVGIPHGDDHKGCKILLTARSRDVLSNKMDCKQNFSIGILNEEEAWSLFKKMAGDYIEGSQFKSVATDVAKKCAGLPVSIVTVARALRNERSVDEWKDALKKLRTPSSTNYKDIQPDAYSAIELSYNKLKGEELKKIFLLIGYAHLESVDELLMYGLGLGLFEDINKMEEAQARVRTLVQKLKASCMLLDNHSKWFSMHDVVRDVAVSIASKVLVSTGDELVNGWESTVKSHISIVLFDVKTNVLPEVLECPQLQLFDIRADDYESPSLTIPDNFFMRMVQVRVINLSDMHLLSLPSSLGLLTNLRTLRLYFCKLQDISVVGDLKNLEILCLQDSEIKQLPMEVGQLARLRSLDLRNCSDLKVIPQNVLSKLSHLEELYIFSFKKWEEKVEGVKNASLDELKHLRNLTSLELYIKDVDILSRGLFFEKLERYDILIGAMRSYLEVEDKTRKFGLKLNNNICLKDGLIVQLQGIEELRLQELKEQDIKYLVDELLGVSSSQLKHLHLRGNLSESKRQDESTADRRSSEIIFKDNAFFTDKVSLQKLKTLELYYVNVGRIWQNRLATMSYGIQNLTRLVVVGCRNLRYIFPSSTVSSFDRLQHLEIRECPKLKEIIAADQEERKNVMFPQFEFLVMEDLEKLKCFYTRDVHIEFPSLKRLNIIKCPEFILHLTKEVFVFSNLEDLAVDGKQMPWICQFPEDFFGKLKWFDVMLDESTIISSLDDFFQRFHSIKKLEIIGDEGRYFYGDLNKNGLEVIVREVNKFCDPNYIWKHGTIIENLKALDIRKLECDNLMNLVPSWTTFQNLTTLTLWECNGLRNVLTTSTTKGLLQLRKMKIAYCYMIIEIVADDQGDATKDEIIFSELRMLVLCDLPSLTSFCSGNCTFKFPSLESLAVENCRQMKIFSGGELSTPNLHKVYRHDYEESDWIWKGDLNTTIQQLYIETKEEDKEENDKSITDSDSEAEGSESQISEEDLGQPSVQHLE